MAREYLILTPETTWGTYNSSGSPIVIDLDQANAYTVRPGPMRWSIRTQSSGNRRRLTGSSKTGLGGNLNMLLPSAYAATIVPWVYSSDGLTLGSMTVDHAILLEDGTTWVQSRDLGMMVQQAQFNSAEQDQLMRLQLQLVGQQRQVPSPALTVPAYTSYPTGPLFVFEHASGGLTVGTSRMDFETFNCTIQNYLDVRFFVSKYAQKIKYCGRDVNWTSRLQYMTNTLRTNYESVTAVAGAITFTDGAATPHTLAFTMESQNFTAGVQDNLQLNQVFLQDISMEAYVDSTAGTDFTLAAT